MTHKKVKKPPLISNKVYTNCFVPTHIKFNFSFITYDENFTNEHKLQFLKRIRELSKVPYMEVLSWDKKIGLEFEKIDIKREISPDFFQSNGHRNFNDRKYAIFRLYTNNNPIVARIVGKVINNVFYIFFIDIGGKLYNH